MTYWPDGIPQQLDVPDVAVGEFLDAVMRRHGPRVAVVDGAEELTFSALNQQAHAFADALRSDGVTRGSCVMLHLPNGRDFVVAYVGALLAGATVSPANPLHPVAGLRSQMDDAAPRVIVTHPDCAPTAIEARGDDALPHIVVVAGSSAAPANTDAAERTDPAEPAGNDDRAGDIESWEDAADVETWVDYVTPRVARSATANGVETRERHASPDVAARSLTVGVEAHASQISPAASPDTSARAQTAEGETPSPDDVAHLAFTGGTTGRSKGVRVLGRNVVANVCQAVAWRAAAAVRLRNGELSLEPFAVTDAGIREGDGVALVVGPMYHAQALINLLSMLTTGARIVILGRFDPARVLAAIETHSVTYITGSPTMWHALLDCSAANTHDLSSLEVVSSGAAPIDPTTMQRLKDVFPSAMLNEGWGLTEATCLVTATPGLHGARRKPGSVGLPVPGTRVEVRGPDGSPLPAGEVGELWINGPQVADGYHGAPELTAEQFVDGWLRTGDVGHVDDEGFYFIDDRLKDMLIYKGYNVYPRELEEVLTQHPAVAHAAVVGRDDAATGQLPVAFVVPIAGADLDAEKVAAFVAARVLPYKRLREVHVLPALPTNAAGKILKTTLRHHLDA